MKEYGLARVGWWLGAAAIAGALWWAFGRDPAPPLDDIDADSRARLDALVREAERAGASAP